MSKLLILGLLGLVAYLILRGLKRSRHDRSATGHMAPAQQMVACAKCGVNLPEMESLKSGGKHYCCEQHRESGPLESER